MKLERAFGDRMPPRSTPFHTTTVVVVLLVLSTSVGFLADSAVRPAPICPTRIGTATCAALPLNPRYDSRTVTIPANSTGWGPLSVLGFEAVQFRLWLASPSAYLRLVQGTASEPDGPELAFAVFASNNSLTEDPSNDTSRAWFSPDGVFGVAWVGESGPLVTVRLYVADPMVRYGAESVSLVPTPFGAAVPGRILFLGVVFQLGESNLPPPTGPTRTATVELPNGTFYELSLWAGPRTACENFLGPDDLFGSASCLESVSTGYEAGVVWTGPLTATLLVGTP